MLPAVIVEKALAADVVLFLKGEQLSYRVTADKGIPEALRQEIKDNKQSIINYLKRLQNEGNVSAARFPEIVPASGEAAFSPSFAQQQLLLVDRLESSSHQFNIQGVFAITGSLNRNALENAINSIVKRHQVLRTNFVELEGVFYPFVNENGEVCIDSMDLTLESESQRSLLLDEIIEEDGKTTFDLENDLMLRVKLVRVAEQENVLILTLHHIAADGWSLGVFIQEVKVLYEAELNNRQTVLAELPIQYSDFSLWQKALLAGEQRTAGIEFWKKYLHGIPSVHSLPLDYKRPAAADFSALRVKQSVESNLLGKLKHLCREKDVTLFMLLQMAFATLLYRCSNSHDIVMGTPMSGRVDARLEPLIGLFLNTVVIRNRFDSAVTFADHLSINKESLLSVHDFQYLPFELLVEEMGHARNTAFNPLFQIWFVLQNNEQIEVALPGCNISTYENKTVDTAKYELNLYLVEKHEELEISWVARKDLFEERTIVYLADEFQSLLEQIAENPNLNVKDYDVFNSIQIHAQQDRLHADVNQGLVVDKFSHQVKTNPQAIAAVDKNVQLTFQELDSLSDSLARQLTAMSSSAVGLLLGHNSDMVVAVLAAIKAGKVYVPMDLSYPVARLTYMVRDAGIGSLIVNQGSVETGFEIVNDIEVELIQISESASDTLPLQWSAPQPSCAAYILYTSGSTGKPKGVVQSHENVAYFVDTYVKQLNITHKDKLLLTASFGHDAAVLDLFAALTTGATLYMVDIRQANSREVINTIKGGISIYHSPASVFKYLFSDASREQCQSIRAVTFGGEGLDSATLRLAKACLAPDCQCVNLYGSTEATIVSFTCETVGNLDESSQLLERVIPGSKITLQNDSRQIVRVYERAEIVVTSPYSTPGYIGREKEYSEKFVTRSDGEMDFYTGDMGYILPNGRIRFLGRKDNQIKLSGMRIEPEEIESYLSACRAVAASVVILKMHEETQQSVLVAFVVLSEKNAIDPKPGIEEEIKTELAQQLPTHMVPSLFVFVDSLRYTKSGKLDRLAMHQVDISLASSRSSVAPGNEIEKRLLPIWEETLQTTIASVNDSFFSLGGNSIKSLKLISKIGYEFETELSMKEFFNAPTIALTAKLIENKAKANRNDKYILVPDPENRYRPFPLTPIQQAYWLGRSGSFELGNVATQGYVEQELSDYQHADMEHALNLLIRRHDMLRMVINQEGEQSVLSDVPEYEIRTYDYIYSPESSLKQHLEKIRQEMSAQVRSVHEWPIFDFRVTLLPDQKARLHVCTDAIIMDARSRAILVKELFELYLDREHKLPELEINFRDYVLAEQKIQETEAYRRAREYWHARIGSLPRAPELPLAKDPSQIKKPVFVRRTCQVDKGVWQKLQLCAARIGVTPICVLITACSDVLGYWSNQRSFILNLTLFNRLPLHEQVDQIVGDFTSSNLLEVNTESCTSFRQRARLIQQQLVDDIDHRLFSGVEVLRTLRSERKHSNSALYPVVFTGLVGFKDEKERASAASKLLASGVTHMGVTQTSQVYLDCQVYDSEDSIAITWNCIDQIFLPGVVDEMFAAYHDWLTKLATDSEKIDSEILNLLPAHQKMLLSSINDTKAEREPVLLHQLFGQSVVKFAGKYAVITPDFQLTYDQLNNCSNRLAADLIARNLQPNQHAAVLMVKGWQQIVAVLGILKAGGAYLPIDANLPRQRVDYILSQTNTNIIVTQDFLDYTPWRDNYHLEVIDSGRYETDLCNSEIEAPLPIAQNADDLAYTIFTSGSTGTPKGVMITHSGAVNTILDINNRFNVCPSDKVFAISELNFDLSVYDIFGSLAVGATIVLPDASDSRNPQAWTQLLVEHEVTVWNSVPALAKLWLDTLTEGGKLPPLRLMLLSGDWIPLDLPARLANRFSNLQVISLGGATEASIWSIFYPINEVDPGWKSIPYGKPLENQTFQILNPELQPCPVGVSGELFIGGRGLAVGYIGDRERTEASFVIHPESREHIYRTGDLGRYMRDGNIEFMGRKDNQVKVNGYRIELGEIEAQLIRFDWIKHAVVSAYGSRYNKRLVVYLVLHHKHNIPDTSSDSLSALIKPVLKSALPDYMVPEFYQVLPAMPLTANGKIDREALPEPDISLNSGREFVEAETPLEQEIAEIWRSILGIQSVGMTENFFTLGGNSILAVRAIMAIREKYNLASEDFQFSEFFTAATIREMAPMIEGLIAHAESRASMDFSAVSEEMESGLL